MRQSRFQETNFQTFLGENTPDPPKKIRVHFHKTPIIWFGTSIPNSVDNAEKHTGKYPIILGKQVITTEFAYVNKNCP